MAKLYRIEDWRNGLANVYFNCPGCNCSHGVWTEEWIKDHDGNGKPIYGPKWGFNNDIDKPTFSPSILIQSHHAGIKEVCHSFITDGMIQFLGDCTHELAGKTVELPDV